MILKLYMQLWRSSNSVISVLLCSNYWERTASSSISSKPPSHHCRAETDTKLILPPHSIHQFYGDACISSMEETGTEINSQWGSIAHNLCLLSVLWRYLKLFAYSIVQSVMGGSPHSVCGPYFIPIKGMIEYYRTVIPWLMLCFGCIASPVSESMQVVYTKRAESTGINDFFYFNSTKSNMPFLPLILYYLQYMYKVSNSSGICSGVVSSWESGFASESWQHI